MTDTQIAVKNLIEGEFSHLVEDGTLPADLWRLDPPDVALWIKSALQDVEDRLAGSEPVMARLQAEIERRRAAAQ